MLNAVQVALKGADQAGILRAAASMHRQGFVAAEQVAWEVGSLKTWAWPSQRDVDELTIHETDGAAYCVGPVWYRGRFGRRALAAIMKDSSAGGGFDEAALRGNFVLFLRTAHQCLLTSDGLGFGRIYTSPDGLFHSTSWLATCAYAGQVALNEPAAIEYVLLGASHSSETVARGITTLPLGNCLDLIRNTRRERSRLWDRNGMEVGFTLDAVVQQLAAHLTTVFTEAAVSFPTRIRAALSGGFDSRLILAGLLRAGIRPELFVYGNAASQDASIARAVAESVDVPLDVIDKSELDAEMSSPTLERMVANALFFDGLPNDGIYDSGVDQRTRLDQTAGGRLGLNGGGGEVFRNYFHLPDRRFSVMDIVRTFYRGFDQRVFRQGAGLSIYEERMEASIACAIGVHGDELGRPLDRRRLELAYPLFRCHHWMAVNNSVALRHGYFATPLIDPLTVTIGSQVPLQWKDAGLLEARLIDALHPGVANQMSEYGFRFSNGPSRKAQFQAWMDRSRPVWARPFINSAGRYLRGHTTASTWLAHCRALLPGEWYVDHLLDLQRVPNAQAVARALAVEVVWRELLS